MRTFGILGGAAATWHPLATIRYSVRKLNAVKNDVAEKIGFYQHCQKSMDDTFLLSNVVPQDVDNNGDFWNRLEIYCRDLTKKESAYPTYIYNILKITISSAQFNDVRVISGPLWLPGDPPTKLEVKSKYEIMRRHHVM